MATRIVNRIPTPAEQLIDQKTGLTTQNWYDFFSALTLPQTLNDYPNDAAAKAGGVPLFALYRTGGTVKVRMT